MMHFHEDQEPESDRSFWLIIFACIILAIAFICEVFVRFYLDVT